jgi:hypothetical protein
MTIDILDGMTVEKAAVIHRIGTRQAAHRIFQSEVPKLFNFDDREAIMAANFDIETIRALWGKSFKTYFQA